jgi:hypothetical protein
MLAGLTGKHHLTGQLGNGPALGPKADFVTPCR